MKPPTYFETTAALFIDSYDIALKTQQHGGHDRQG